MTFKFLRKLFSVAPQFAGADVAQAARAGFHAKRQCPGWLLRTRTLPWIYGNAMLKGREWVGYPGNRVAA